MRIEHLAIAVTFHYAEARLAYLSRISSEFESLADRVSVHIFTNVGDDHLKARISDALGRQRNFFAEIHTPTLLGHPYLLTWSHLGYFRKLFLDDSSVTHFMYLEDDIRIRIHNIEYWLENRPLLKQVGLIPSFLRYELIPGNDLPYSTDVPTAVELDSIPWVKLSADYLYVNFPNPYQGMYLLDRELMEEHLFGPSSSPDFGPWQIREKAAQGVTFSRVPNGCFSRNFVGYDLRVGSIDPRSLIHHTPNTYAIDPNSPAAKVQIARMLTGVQACAPRDASDVR